MKTWKDIESLSNGDTILRKNGLKAKPSEIYVIRIEVKGNYAIMCWSWDKDSDSYYSTDFRKSDKFADYGIWNDLTTQMWSK